MVQGISVQAVVSACHYRQVGADAVHMLHNLQSLLTVIDGHHQQACLIDACRFQQLGAAGIAEISFDAVARHAVHGVCIIINHRGRIAAGNQQVVNHLAEAAVPADNHRVLLVDFIMLPLSAPISTRCQNFIVHNKQ